MSVTNITVQASQDAIREWQAFTPPPKANDKGMTIGELSELHGVHRSTMTMRIREWLKKGAITKGLGSRMTANGRMVPTPVYLPAMKPDSKARKARKK